MKRFIIFLIIALLSFGIGWWLNEMRHFAIGVTADFKRFEKLKGRNSNRIDSASVLKKHKNTIPYGVHWRTKHSDTTQFTCEIVFEKEYAVYWYHGQCVYYYFTYKTSETNIDLLWSYKTDCLLNMGFLSKTHGLKKYPKNGDLFATYTLINDSTIQAKYNYSEWAKKINEIAKDSVFPLNFYLGESDL